MYIILRARPLGTRMHVRSRSTKFHLIDVIYHPPISRFCALSDIPKFNTVLLHSNWSKLRPKYLSQIPTDINVLSCGPKAQISWISDAIYPTRHLQKNPRSMYARVLQVMAQFVLKIEKLSHIMGPTPVLEMARAYGLRPRLWLLVLLKSICENITNQKSYLVQRIANISILNEIWK